MKLLSRILKTVDARDGYVVMALVGMTLVAWGLWNIYWPAAPIVVGMVLIYLALAGVKHIGPLT